MKTAIRTDAAPKAVGPYSQAVRSGDWLWLSMQLPLDPATGRLVEGDAAAQARRAIENIRAVARAGGADLADVVRTTLYLVDLSDFPAVNTVYAEYFGDPAPARSTVGAAALPLGARVALDAVARIGG
jgi:2-iminobutanoate/2-iminopropanoate deaminase